MAHRVRSRTAESAENKKTKVTPRRLTEKIAIMRRREHEQSEAFQKAMKSIFEACTNTCVCVCLCMLLSAYVQMKMKIGRPFYQYKLLFLFSFRPPRFNWVLRGFPFYCNTNVVLLSLGACVQRGLQWLLCVSISLSVSLSVTRHLTSRAINRSTNNTTYSASVAETAAFGSYGVKLERKSQYAN